uniref:Uncharacterized protein n=1 Tax=Octopus bimaculoides TaxID=37653 RepID=A0A0L8GRK0_OCTBM
MQHTEAIFIKIQLRWSGHLSRVIDIRIPKQLLFGQFSTGRSVGRPFLRFKDKLKDNLKRCYIPFLPGKTKHQNAGSGANPASPQLTDLSNVDSSIRTNFVQARSQNAAPLN